MNQDTKGPVSPGRSWAFPRVGDSQNLDQKSEDIAYRYPASKLPFPLCPSSTLSPYVLVSTQMFICYVLLTLGLE